MGGRMGGPGYGGMAGGANGGGYGGGSSVMSGYGGMGSSGYASGSTYAVSGNSADQRRQRREEMPFEGFYAPPMMRNDAMQMGW